MTNPFDHTITFGEDYYDFDGDVLWTANGPGGLGENGRIDVLLEPSGGLEVELDRNGEVSVGMTP